MRLLWLRCDSPAEARAAHRALWLPESRSLEFVYTCTGPDLDLTVECSWSLIISFVFPPEIFLVEGQCISMIHNVLVNSGGGLNSQNWFSHSPGDCESSAWEFWCGPSSWLADGATFLLCAHLVSPRCPYLQSTSPIRPVPYPHDLITTRRPHFQIP